MPPGPANDVIMPRKILFLLFLVLLLIPLPAPGSDKTSAELSRKELDALLLRAEENFGSITSLKTRFIEEKHLSFFKDPVVTRGFCLFQAPGNIRFETTEPYRSILIVQGKKVAKFESEEGNWKKIPQGNTDGLLMVIGQIRSWLKGQFRDAENLYHIKASAGEQAVITLTPRDPRFRKMLRSIEIALKPGETGLSYILLNEWEKDFTRISFLEDRLNPKLSPDLFRTDLIPPTPLAAW